MLALITAACGGGDDSEPPNESLTTVDDGDAGSADATMTIGDETWGFANVACIVGVDSFDFLASDGLIGVDLSTPNLVVKILGEGGDDGATGSTSIVLFASAPALTWTSTSEVGEAVVRVDGSRVTGEGLFDDGLTQGTTEGVAGSFDLDCGEMPEPPEVTTTLLPDFEANGSVIVDGETFSFTYESPGATCGVGTPEGTLSSRGFLVDDPTRQVIFTYALGESTDDGNPVLQLIIYAADGTQLWYSAVGYSGISTGSVESISQNGNTVSVSGTLLLSGSAPEEFAEFTAEVTCNQ